MKVLFLIDSFSFGGAQRVLSILFKKFVQDGLNVTLVADTINHPILFDIPTGVKLRPVSYKIEGKCGKLSVIASYYKRFRNVTRIVKEENPDIVVGEMTISFLSGLIASRINKKPFIIHDHTAFFRKMGFVTDIQRYHLYGLADRLVILCNRDEKLLGKKYPNKVIINNPLPFEPIVAKHERKKRILCAGRTDVWKVKGFDRIVSIYAQLAAKHPDWILTFSGDGKLTNTEYVKALCKEAGIIEHVEFLGHVPYMKSLYAESEIFALPSRVEGFPMVLIEAMSQGCACISFDIQGVASEIIENGLSGCCIKDDDIDAFASKLDEMMSNESLRSSFSLNGIRRSKEYLPSLIAKQWYQLFNSLLTK